MRKPCLIDRLKKLRDGHGTGTLCAKIVGRCHDAAPEQMTPDAVGHDAGGEGVVRAGDPFGKFEAAAGFPGNRGRGRHCDSDRNN